MTRAYCFALLVLAVNLLIIFQYGTDVPFWDQWDSEAELYIKWEEGTLTLADLVKPHVQHRFAVSRVLRLALFELFGGWSPLGNMIVQSLFVPLIFLVFFRFVRKRLAERWKEAVFYLLAALAFVCPFYWETILLGFQSHFYLSLVVGLLLLRLAAGEPRGATACWFAVLGLAATFTSASAMVSLIAVLIIQLLALVPFRQWRRFPAVMMIGITTVLIWLNAWLMVVPEEQRQYGARGVFDLIWLSLQAFSWPVEYLGILALWIVPLATVGCVYRAWTVAGFREVIGCVVRDRSNLVIFSFLLWLVLSIGSIAYARGHYALFASRYMNIYLFSLFVPFFVYLLYFDGVRQLLLGRLAKGGLALLYCALAVGFVKELAQEFDRCRQYKADMDIVRANLITALQQNSAQYLYDQQRIKPIYGAHPDPGRVFRRMVHPALHGKLLWLPEDVTGPEGQ